MVLGLVAFFCDVVVNSRPQNIAKLQVFAGGNFYQLLLRGFSDLRTYSHTLGFGFLAFVCHVAPPVKVTHRLSRWVFIFGRSPCLLARVLSTHLSTWQSLRLLLATLKRVIRIIYT